MIERLKKLQADKEQYSDGGKLLNACNTNTALQNQIEALSKAFLGRSVSGCGNCYMDAYIQLIHLDIKKAMEKLECQFKLLAGVLLHDVVNFDNNLLCSNANITDHLALYHLKSNPNCRSKFQQLPDDVDELIDAYVLSSEHDLSDRENEKIKESKEKKLTKKFIKKEDTGQNT